MALFPGAATVQAVAFDIGMPLDLVPTRNTPTPSSSTPKPPPPPSVSGQPTTGCSSSFLSSLQLDLVSRMPFGAVNVTSLACDGAQEAARKAAAANGTAAAAPAAGGPAKRSTTTSSGNGGGNARRLMQQQAPPPSVAGTASSNSTMKQGGPGSNGNATTGPDERLATGVCSGEPAATVTVTLQVWNGVGWGAVGGVLVLYALLGQFALLARACTG